MSTESKNSLLQSPNTQQNQLSYDAIVVLGGAAVSDGKGGFIPNYFGRTRTRAAVQAYQTGLTDKLLFTGGKTRGESLPTESTVAIAYMNRRFRNDTGKFRRVNPNDIYAEGKSKTTESNIQEVLPILQEQGFRRIGILTNDFHVTNSVRLAKKYGIDAYPVPAEPLLLERGHHYQHVIDRFEETEMAKTFRNRERIRTILLYTGPLRKPVEAVIRKIRS